MEEVEWRRRWTKNLKCSVWQRITIDDDRGPLFVKYCSDDEHYEVLFTDLVNTWTERLHSKDIERRNREINPTVEVPLAKLLSQLEEVLKDRSQGTNYKLMPSPDGMDLTVSFKFVGLHFSWKFCGKSANPNMVCEHFAVPLMTMVSHLTHQRDQLICLLKSKDKEIFDLKSQGIKTSRKNLETKIFDETSFINEMLSSHEFEEQVKTEGRVDAFNDHGKKLYHAIMMKANWLENLAKANIGEVSTKEQTFDGSVIQTLPSNGGNSWASNRVPTSIVTPAANMTPDTSPNKTPSKQETSKDIELLRRQQLEEKLAEQEEKEQKKKKKKMKF